MKDDQIVINRAIEILFMEIHKLDMNMQIDFLERSIKNLEIDHIMLKKKIKSPQFIDVLNNNWQTKYLNITINFYYSEDHRRVLNRLKTFAKKKSIEIEEVNAGQDNSDTYMEISAGLRNQWFEYKLAFEKYIESDEILEFFSQFDEIKIEKK